jgi:hypothetical protein
MAEADKDANQSAGSDATTQVTISRRAFVKGTAISAMGTVFLNKISGPAHAEDRSGEMRVLGLDRCHSRCS